MLDISQLHSAGAALLLAVLAVLRWQKDPDSLLVTAGVQRNKR